ncbi:MAG: IS110 family transposase [Deltaproteobacteria bacterium]
MNDSTLPRLEEFRKLKNEIRGSEEHLIVGIDVAKEKHHAYFGTATGKSLLRKLIFDNSIEGFGTLLHRARAIMIQEGLPKVVYGVEPTADYHKPLGEFLIKQDQPLVLVSNGAVKQNRELLDGRWDKNDTKDSANVADLISQGKFLYYDLPSVEIRDLRHLASFKRKLKVQEHSLRMRIRNHLVTQFFPELDKFYGHREGENLAIVKWCLDPSRIASMEFERFFHMVTTRNMGEGQRRRLRSIQEVARKSVGCEVGMSTGFEAKMLVDQLKRVREMITQTDARIAAVCRQIAGHKSINSIPGFGPVITAEVMTALGDPHRFTSSKQVLKLAGLDLSASRSGKSSEKVCAKISKKGKAALRYALYQAALIATTRNKYFIEYFSNLLTGREREQGIKTKMRVKVAAKMLVIAWTLWKNGEVFQGKYLLQ